MKRPVRGFFVFTSVESLLSKASGNKKGKREALAFHVFGRPPSRITAGNPISLLYSYTPILLLSTYTAFFLNPD
jgi:hypothetical protein